MVNFVGQLVGLFLLAAILLALFSVNKGVNEELQLFMMITATG